jgi:hypothetical protein
VAENFSHQISSVKPPSPQVTRPPTTTSQSPLSIWRTFTRSPRPCPPPNQHPPTSAKPANTSRHAKNQNEFSPSYIAQLEYEIANPCPHSEICEEIRQGILKQSPPTERAELMWKHAIAIGRISPSTNAPIPVHQLPDASPETQELLSHPLPWPPPIIQVSATPEPSGPPNTLPHIQPTQKIDTGEISGPYNIHFLQKCCRVSQGAAKAKAEKSHKSQLTTPHSSGLSEWSPPYRSNRCFHTRQPNNTIALPPRPAPSQPLAPSTTPAPTLKPSQPLHGVWSTVSPKRKAAIKTLPTEA